MKNLKKVLILVMTLVATLTLVACANGGDKKAVEAAEKSLSTLISEEKITATFVLVESNKDGVKFEYTSSNESHLKIEETATGLRATVIRPVHTAADVAVTLTVKLTKNKVTSTKTFNLIIVKEDAPDVTGDNLKAVIEAGAKGQVIEMDNVVVIGTSTGGYFVADSSASIYVHLNSDGSKVVKVGEKGKISAKIDDYYGAKQLTSPSFTKASDDKLSEITPTNRIPSFYWNPGLAGEALNAAKANLTNSAYTKLTAKVIQDGTGENSIFLADVADQTKYVQVYYKGTVNADVLTPLIGQTIEVEGMLQEYRDGFDLIDGTKGTLSRFTAFRVVSELNDESKVSIDASKIAATLKPAYDKETDLTLVDKGSNGTTITWAFASETDPNNQYINLTTGKLTMPAEAGQLEVKVIATVILNDKTKTVPVTIKVGTPTVITTIANAKLALKGDIVLVKGIVVGATFSNKYANGEVYIQDETGGMLVYRAPKANADIIVVGNEIQFIATIDNYNGVNQFANAKSITKVSEGNTVEALSLTKVTKDSNDLGKLVKVTLKVTKDLTAVASKADADTFVGDFTLGTGKFTVKFLRQDNTVVADAEAIANLLKALKKDDQIEVTAVLTKDGEVTVYSASQIIKK
ncbi:immunoglobulin-like domain-containing protein [Haploplasma axanthum]|uniref:Atrophied bacterial Ig domain-containing protein n=1 Tax=Haploplasma axanthum TaxID=29552 RepID=A0A449BC95_HAPAX|nr:immunoglobulin-like domain-containing protein [Haploplasma axanthum]VEU80052.1 Uncharacterised protein [Haploplasma axanthum]